MKAKTYYIHPAELTPILCTCNCRRGIVSFKLIKSSDIPKMVERAAKEAWERGGVRVTGVTCWRRLPAWRKRQYRDDTRAMFQSIGLLP